MIFRFWSNYAADGSDIYKKTSIYRSIQILANILNDIQQNIIVPVTMLECIIALGVSLAMLVHTLPTSENIPIFIIMSNACVDTLLFLLISLGGLAAVCKESRMILHKIKSGFSSVFRRREKMWIQRFVKSCGVIQMRFGGNNFVDDLTPLNCISHAAQLTLQILLLWRNH